MRLKKNEKGFTLIELAIVIVVSSLFLFTIFKALALYSETLAQEQTEENIDVLEASISRFFQQNGRYPCPARIDAVPGDADYGREALIGTTDCDHESFPGAAAPFFNDDPSGDPLEDLLVIGSVPIHTIEPCLLQDLVECETRDLYLTEEALYDGWGNRLTYAVTKELADPTGNFQNSLGVIDIQDENQQSILEEPYSAHYVLVSHGPNGRGAFNREGNRVQDNCVTFEVSGTPTPFPSESGIHSERENCDLDDGLFVSALLNETDPDRRYYDDVISFQLVELSALWQRTGLSEMINLNEGGVGIGDFTEGTDAPEGELHIKGDLQAVDLYADALCDAGGNCFRPEFLGGDAKTTEDTTDPLDYINTCANESEAIVSIENNQVTCAPVFSGAIIPGECAKDDPVTTTENEYEVMVGYSNETGIVCERLYP